MNYGRFAQSYQIISRTIFGSALLDAQKKALANLRYPCNLLIVGGGDGEILKCLSDFEGILDYVEVSSEMVSVAQSKSKLPVNWYVEDIFSFITELRYDVIFLPFVLDNFTTPQCSNLILHLKQMLKSEGEITVVDFTEKPNLWQKGLLTLMYGFFRLLAQVNVNKMPEIEQAMAICGLQKTLEMKSFRGFIEINKYSLN